MKTQHPVFQIETLTAEDIAIATSFANDCSYKYWQTTANYSSEKCKQGTILGKLGELLAYKKLLPYLPSLKAPDFTIYSAKKKSFAPDLSSFSHGIHVKTQQMEQATKYGDASWVFEKSDPATYTEEPENLICLTQIKQETLQGRIVSIFKQPLALTLNLFREMKAPALRATKVAIYGATILQASMLFSFPL